MKIFHLALLGLLIPSAAFADSVGGCGWGSKLFDGQRGVAPQVMAVTTNGTFGNQTFGISTGTSGCSQDGVVTSAWQTAAYIDGNMNRLARDMSRGEGESLAGLAELIKVPSAQQPEFNSLLQKHFGEIFTSVDVTSADVTTALRNVLKSDPTFGAYAANV